MILYHGTCHDFNKIDFSKFKDKRDFGKGFYTTTILEQAEKWAENQRLRYGKESAIVKCFEYKQNDNLKIKIFDEMSEEWLDFIKKCRTEGGTPHDYDIIQGPVANDNTMRTIALYISGIYTTKQAIEQLKYFKVNNQISFHSEKAMLTLKWIEDREVKNV